MDTNELFHFYMKEINQDFKGWDFSFINHRLVESVKPWSYHSLIIPYILNSTCLLDMGTGGGEFLSILPFPKTTFATEFYKPNIPIAKKRLEPLGIKVTPLENEEILPFSEDYFETRDGPSRGHDSFGSGTRPHKQIYDSTA